MDREYVINNYSKNNFMDFLQYDATGRILELLNEEGINILKKSTLKSERVAYIIEFSPYRSELLENTLFLDVFLDTAIVNYYGSLCRLNFDACNSIINRAIELDERPEKIARLFGWFDLDYKLNKLENWSYSQELLYCILKNDHHAEVIQKIIDNYNIDLTQYNINLEGFFKRAKESVLIAQEKRNKENLEVASINIPSTMITEELAEKIWKDYDIFAARAIINNAEYCTDATLLNNYIRKKEEEKIYSYYNDASNLQLEEIYEAFVKYKNAELEFDKDEETYPIYDKCTMEYLSLIRKIKDGDKLAKRLEEIHSEYGLEKAKEFLLRINENSLSNYIIDYHFQENFHNIMFDVRELLNFYYNGEIALPVERVELYEKISNIDYLSIEEKIELHTILKQFNMVELFYDDMALARYIVAEAIKEYSLSSQSIKEYKDEELSKKYGVDVYNMNGNSFFGIVKTGRHPQDQMPTGHSYSLVGAGGIAVYGNVKDSNTYLYDSNDLNPNQIVHAFPYDSFTLYRPFESSSEGTNKVNILAMPQEITSTSRGLYSELLILEKGKQETDIDSAIPELKRIALYCIDEIRQQDIEQAKSKNVGIILIDSSKYKQAEYQNFSSYHRDINSYEYEYFNGSYDLDKYEAKRY